MNIQQRIKIRRQELGLTMKDVSSALGVSEATVSRYESGDIRNMGIDKMEALSKVLQCSPAYLMGWEEKFNKSVSDALLHSEMLKDSSYVKLYESWRNLTGYNKSIITDLVEILLKKQE